ncbi:non-canonical purine NTP pyrophosphatase [Microvirga guangxiensis]|uniref:Ham1 family protein n=1 Tax=Microvirga guangxiensis TaxID=549386 RepID=A0A1G5F5P1_9HYPH|nr:non-canonical purine NTP pyrophosphatase [Microvirga guangxiensis]SCY34543.1 Ham1 family protein [Microvirga guangxiensis]
MTKILITYASSSRFKKQEVEVLLESGTFPDSSGRERKIGDHFRFDFSGIRTDEPLEIDLIEMVKHKARSAYRSLLMPCIVEHAGLILGANYEQGFPGGLTQPMWDALGAEEFLRRTASVGEPVVARAVIGYCDGMSVRTFVGETKGTVADAPRGDRDFYWDTIFCPDEIQPGTYAEIAGDPERGIRVKMTISQSYRAMRQFLCMRFSQEETGLFAAE